MLYDWEWKDIKKIIVEHRLTAYLLSISGQHILLFYNFEIIYLSLNFRLDMNNLNHVGVLNYQPIHFIRTYMLGVLKNKIGCCSDVQWYK